MFVQRTVVVHRAVGCIVLVFLCAIGTDDVNECDPNPCKNEAVCTNGRNQYTCSCKPGWKGRNCDKGCMTPFDSVYEYTDKCTTTIKQGGSFVTNGTVLNVRCRFGDTYDLSGKKYDDSDPPTVQCINEKLGTAKLSCPDGCESPFDSIYEYTAASYDEKTRGGSFVTNGTVLNVRCRFGDTYDLSGDKYDGSDPPTVQCINGQLGTANISCPDGSGNASLMFKNQSRPDMTEFFITSTGYVTSPGYPDTYPEYGVYRWTLNLNLTEETHVGVQFIDISLREFKEEDKCHSTVEMEKCHDTVKFVVKDPRDVFNYRLNLTSNHNGEKPSFDFTVGNIYFETVYIEFIVCSSGDYSSEGKGFRAIIYSTLSERNPCFQIRQPDVYFKECIKPQGEVIGETLWGKSPFRFFHWHIKPGSYTILTFEIIEMELPCSLGYYLTFLTFDGTGICNGNRPYGDQSYVVLSQRRILVRYSYEPGILIGVNQGFRLSYQKKYAESYPVYKEEYTVCSTPYGKCYTFSIATNSSWEDVAENCRKRNTRLASMKTEKELRFVRSMIIKYYRSSIDEIQIYSYIGLFSFVDSTGRLLESWYDGTSPTYTAWDTDQPFRRDILRCTKLQILNLNTFNSWKSCPCDEKSRTLAVCERTEEGFSSLQTMSPTSSYGNLPLGRRDPATLFHCSSGEWMSRLVVCNHIAECFDASDESNCIYNNICDEDEFECADGTCIHVSEVCDYKSDSSDGSDEFCVYSDCNDQFKCDNGQCISTDERCDAIKHCKDGSDEHDCESCNAKKAFHCVLSRTCVSKRLVYDKVEDCSGGSDEQLVNSNGFHTCKDLWLNGKRTSGYFNVKSGEEGKEVYIFCDFDSAEASGEVTMKIFNSETIPLCADKYQIRLPVDLIDVLKNGFRCTQRIARLRVRSRLLPVRAGFSFDEEYIDVDFAGFPNFTQFFRDYKYQVKGLPWMKNVYEVYLRKPLQTGYIIDRGDIICTATFPKEEPKLYCREGIAGVSTSHRCLYKRDTNGYVTGCRTLEHLNNCDNTSCPEHFFKCPDSYCIPLMYVCDGNNDCAYGEDELVCGCPNKPTANIVILSAVRVHDTALQLAGMLFSSNSTVRVLNIRKHDNTLIGTEVLSNTKHSSKANVSYFYKDVGKLFEDSEGNSTLIVITEDKDKYETETFLLISDILSAQTNLTYKIYNVTIAKASNRLITRRKTFKSTEIIIKDEKIIGTIGPVLFPELCSGMLRCAGLYRCRLSKVCIPQHHVCDNTTHCPFGDDEDHCDFVCPSNCSCDLLIVNCSNVQMNGDFNLSVSTRVLDISHSHSLAIKLLENIGRNISFSFLLRLNASWCGLKSINTDAFKFIPNLISLDLSYNNFSEFEQKMFVNLKSLKDLFLTGNIFLTTIDQGAFNGLHLKSLTIAGAKLYKLQANTFAGSSLTSLDIYGNDLKAIDDFAFNGSMIQILNIDENSIESFGKNVFSGVLGLKHLTSPAYKFCCFRPMQLAEENCLPTKDEFSSCEDLMRKTALQALLWTIGFLALFGNLFSLCYRLIYDRKKMKLGYGIFVTNLAVSDLMMGIYMLIIAVADTLYRTKYVEHENYWRNSAWCKLAGILSTLSSEGSVFFLFLITLDRILVVKFPYGQIRFRTKSAMVAAMIVWIVVLVIAILPVVYETYFQERFYSKTGVCLALPLTRDKPPGWLYSIMIFIFFNIIAFILIATGQWLIYLEILKNRMTKRGMNVSGRETDLKVARNLLLVVATDFACWFPICTMGLMALSGHVIPGEVYAWTAVLILPVNSALNPFLYTISAIYGAKKFNPREDEQSHQRVNTEVGKDILTIFRGVTDNVTQSRRRRSLADLLASRSLTTYEAARIIYQVARLLHHLHENGLVLKDIVKDDIWLEISKNGGIKRIRVDTTRGLELTPKKVHFRENMLKLGHLADFVLGGWKQHVSR